MQAVVLNIPRWFSHRYRPRRSGYQPIDSDEVETGGPSCTKKKLFLFLLSTAVLAVSTVAFCLQYYVTGSLVFISIPIGYGLYLPLRNVEWRKPFRNLSSCFKSTEISIPEQPSLDPLAQAIVQPQILNQPLPGPSNTESPLPGTSSTDSQIPEASRTESPLPGTSSTDSQIPETSRTESPLPETSSTDSQMPGASRTESPLPGASRTESLLPGTPRTQSPLPGTTRINSLFLETSGTESPLPEKSSSAD